MQEVSRTVDPNRRGRAVEYVRMSTDRQEYSTANQRDVLASYAARRGLTVVRTYADGGRSGISLEGRDALKALIADVRSGHADFEFILVYDVSRWGRFQDADESAYYEFICKEAGIQVLYCAEQFENDGSLASTVLKNIKRAMAGEYSRELSAKTFAGQCRLASMGFWQGGPPGYGFRRLLIDESRVPKFELAPGQQKNLQTERVILVPGPESELQTVRRIFNSFVNEGKGEAAIAAELNVDQIRNALGNHWQRSAVHDILINEKYAGNFVFNRSSTKLRRKWMANPPEMWVRRDGAFSPIIEAHVFANAQGIIAKRGRAMSDQYMLDRLKALWQEKGYLSNNIVRAAGDMPGSTTYRKRFGGLLAAYRKIGFEPSLPQHFHEVMVSLKQTLAVLLGDVISKIEALGGAAKLDKRRRILTINHSLKIAVGIGWNAGQEGVPPRWRVTFAARPDAELYVIVKLEPSNETIQEYYLIPIAGTYRAKWLRKIISNPAYGERYRRGNLDAFISLCGREELRDLA